MKTRLLITLLCLPSIALAHGGHTESSSFMQGILHPILGLDHLMALIAGGIWLSRSNLKFRLVSSLGFIALSALAMSVGSIVPSIHFEWSLIATLVVLPTFMVLANRWQSTLGVSLLAVATVLHGIAHGSELNPGLSWGGVLLASTAVLLTVAIIAQAISTQKIQMPSITKSDRS